MARPSSIGRDIGPELVAARAEGILWKLLMHRYGLGRTRLWEIWREALRARKPSKRDGGEPRDDRAEA